MIIFLLSWFMLVGVLFVSFNVFVILGFWQQGYGQGNMEYSVIEVSGKMFIINCIGNLDQNGFYQYLVFFIFVDDKMVSLYDDDIIIIVVMDYQQYIILFSLGWCNGDNVWFDFISNIFEVGQFDVYVNDYKVGIFIVDWKNVEKVLFIFGDCSND